MTVERFGQHSDRVQVVATKAEGFRLDIGDVVRLTQRKEHCHTVVFALTIGVWNYEGQWVPHSMCNLAAGCQVFYLLCPASWAVHPERIREASIVIRNGQREEIRRKISRNEDLPNVRAPRLPLQHSGKPKAVDAPVFFRVHEDDIYRRSTARQQLAQFWRKAILRMPDLAGIRETSGGKAGE